MIHSFCAEYKDVLLRPLHRYDIERLREWRNADSNQYLRRLESITAEKQVKWFADYLNDPNVMFFSIDYQRERTVGAMALYGFDGDHCQIGKIIVGKPELKGKGIGKLSFIIAMCIGITVLKMNRYELSVHEQNIPARKSYERIGFQRIGSHRFEGGGIEYEMSIDKKTYFLNNKEIIQNIKVYEEDSINETDGEMIYAQYE